MQCKCGELMMELSPERCHNEGFIINWCPKCGTIFRRDLNDMSTTGDQCLSPASQWPNNSKTKLVAEGMSKVTLFHPDFSNPATQLTSVTRWLQEYNGQWKTSVRIEVVAPPQGFSINDATLIAKALEATLDEAKILEVERP